MLYETKLLHTNVCIKLFLRYFVSLDTKYCISLVFLSDASVKIHFNAPSKLGLATAPSWQATQLLWSALGEVPAGHSLQAGAPGRATEPTGQGPHSLRFWAEGMVPAPHGTQRSPCSGMWPAWHGLQAGAPGAATEPTSQGRHSLRFLAEGMVPAPHGTQRSPCSGM